MLIETFAIPMLTLVLGVVSLAFDSNDNHRHRSLMLGFIVLAFLGICGFEIDANIKAEKEKQADAERIASLDRRNDALTDYLTRIETTANDTNASVAALLAQLSDQGYSLDTLEAVEQSLEADEALQAELDDNSDAWIDPTAQPTTVRYLAQDIDPATVGVKLEELGFDAIAVDTDQDTSTNTISFGTDVSVAEVQLVALTLVRAGVQIRAIRPLPADEAGPKLIQVGNDADLEEACAVWSVEAIQAATTFDTNVKGCGPISAEVAQQI